MHVCIYYILLLKLHLGVYCLRVAGGVCIVEYTCADVKGQLVGVNSSSHHMGPED